MPQPSTSIILKKFFFLHIILAYLTVPLLSQERPRTLYNLPPLPDEENHFILNLTPSTTTTTTQSTKKNPLNNNNIPPHHLPLFHQPLGPLLQLPLPQVPLFDRYNDVHMKSELPPLPEESLSGYYDSDGMFVPNHQKVVESNKTHHLLAKNQMAAAATFVSTNENQSQHDFDDEIIPQEIFPEPILKKKNVNGNNHNSERDSIEKDFIISKSNLFIDGFGNQNDNVNHDEVKTTTEESVISHVTPKIIEDHGDLSLPKSEVKIIDTSKKGESKIAPSSTGVTMAPIGLEEQFQKTFQTTINRPSHGRRISSMTQQFIRTTLSPKLILRNQNKNGGPRVIPNFRKHSFQSTFNNNINNNINKNNNNNIRSDAFLKRRPISQQSQFDLPLPAGNDNKKNNNNFQVINSDNISGKGTSIQQQSKNKITPANSFSNPPTKNNINNSNNNNNNNKINEIITKNRNNQRQNLPPIPLIPNPSIPNEKKPSDGGKKKSKIPGKINLPSLLSLPTPIVNRLGNGEEQRSSNFIRNGAVSLQQRNHIPKTVIKTSQINVRNPTDSMFTNDVDWFDWEMYQNGKNLGILPPNLINDPNSLRSAIITTNNNNNNNNRGQQFQSPPIAVSPSNFISRTSPWRNIPNQQQQQQHSQQPRASGAQQLPVQVQPADIDIPPDSVILTNPPQLELNLPGYGKQTPLPEIPTTGNSNQNTVENLVPFENTNTGRVSTSQLTTGQPYQNTFYNNGNSYNRNNINNNNNNNNYHRHWNNNNNNNNYYNNQNRNYYQNQNQNNQPSLLNLFNLNPFGGFNLFG